MGSKGGTKSDFVQDPTLESVARRSRTTSDRSRTRESVLPRRFSELQLMLEPARGELVRAFVREAALAEGVPASVASLIADDTAQAWAALCAPGSDRERARIALLCSRRDVRARILLHGHSRFSNVVVSLASRIRRDAGISYHEHGIDGWEVSLHRSLTGNAEPHAPLPRSRRPRRRRRRQRASIPSTCRRKAMRRRSPAASSKSMAITMSTRRCSRRTATGTRLRAASLFRRWRATARAR